MDNVEPPIRSRAIRNTVAVRHISVAPEGGWFIAHENGYIHLTAEWLDEMWRHQINPRRARDPESSRVIPAEGEAAFNRLRYLINHGEATEFDVRLLFEEAYGAIIKNRGDRMNLGLKAVTRDGDEDVRAVAAGAPVRLWNSANRKSELHEWVKEQRANRD